ncbi:hypothetical protein SPRG_08759 [Saprolegnia parasitica CBS 223.65]|uniref:C2H2-type domain-containing protein n=1 Tax=Saprolegnia parasitica (strain CBS 223.65) TaxID=695850 RepID=A0A067CH02_SAPPC|nr:hypothetical protein SPRG_08759 [Saprolegnia parasitica CBS 223.65]KDO25816.1 hypothetical protein SPRG_08759 [Saprolegnia parasitica CBS 223.65]|eukprot:XP_012203381.1 hypothetical protein SPRG_08759 [Saprolegnia parasitica CBS 223.65]
MTRKPTDLSMMGVPPSHPNPLKRTRSATAREATELPPTMPSMPSMQLSMLNNGGLPSMLPSLERRSSSTFSISSLMPLDRGMSNMGNMALPVFHSSAEPPSRQSSMLVSEYMYPADIQPMTFDDKQRLVHRITMLPSQYLRGLIDVIKKYQPDTVRQLDEEYVFDLEQMRENTVYAIQDYVQIAFSELDEYVKTLTTASKPSQHSMGMNMIENYEAPRYGASAKSSLDEPQSKRRHTVTSAAVDNATKQVLQTNGQIKFMEQVEMYSKPKTSKTKTKPSQRHQCETCQKMFRGRSELQNHIRTHTGAKPLVCSYAGCGKTYAHSSNLRAHERSHEGIKPYVCHYDGCGKRFAHSVSLKEHIWMHAGVQPYECPFPGCGKRFTQVSNFARHKKLHGAAASKASSANESTVNL